MTPLKATALALVLVTATALAQDDDFLTWNQERIASVVEGAYGDGKVGSRTLLFWTGWDTRLLKTERAQNYKLRATWFTPDVVKASARFAQMKSRLNADDTRRLVQEAEGAGDTVVVVDIDPNEGSGVVPMDWEAFLRPKDAPTESGRYVRGVITEDLRKVKALQPIAQRNYDYDRYWVVFPLTTESGAPLFGPGDTTAELLVRIYNREGVVSWPIHADLRARLAR